MADQPKLVLAGNSEEAQKAIAQLERKFDSLEQRIKRLKESPKSAGFDGVGKELDGALMRLGSMVTVGAAVSAVFSGMTAKAAEFNDKLDETWRKQRQAELKLQIQSGKTPAEVQAAMPVLEQALRKTPIMSLDELTLMQMEIAGAGFEEGDVESGQAAKAMLRLQAATLSFGKGMADPQEAARGISQLLISQGSDTGAADVERLGMKTVALAAKTNLQFADLKQLSQVAGTLSQFGMSESEQLAAFAKTSQVGGPQIGSTGLRVMATRMATAGADKEQIKTLESIGLKPEDVAIAKGGITMGQAGETLRAAMAKKTEVEKNIFMKEFFGGEAASAASALLSEKGMAEYQNWTKLADNAKVQMEERVSSYETSREAVQARPEIDMQIALRRKALRGQTWGEWDEQEKAEFIKRTAEASGPIGRMGEYYTATVESMASRVAKMSGQDPADYWGASGLTSKTNEDWKKKAEEQLAEIKKQTALLEKLANKPEPPRPVNRNGQAE